MIIRRDLLTVLGLYIRFYDNLIIRSEGPFEGYSTTMVDVIDGNYPFSITTK